MNAIANTDRSPRPRARDVRDDAVRLTATLGNQARVARELGISDSAMYRMAADPEFGAAVHRERCRMVQTEGGSLGYAVLKELAASAPKVVDGVLIPGAPAAVRRAAAQNLMEFAGHSPAVAAAEALAAESRALLHEMTPDQLERHIASARAALGELRRQVSTVEGVAEDADAAARPATPESEAAPALW